MSSGNIVLNPYQPSHLDFEAHQLGLNPFASLELNVQRKWLYRRFNFRGMFNTEIVWDARSATEFIKVDGRVAASQIAFLYVPCFDFEIPLGDRCLPARLKVAISWLFWVSELQLTIDNEPVYTECGVHVSHG